MLITMITIALILSIAIPFGYLRISSRPNAKGALFSNIGAFFVTLIGTAVYLFSNTALAAGQETAAGSDIGTGMLYLAAALATGMATIGAGIAVAAAASAALGAIGENEKIMGKALIFVALAEGIALYGLLVSFMIIGNL